VRSGSPAGGSEVRPFPHSSRRARRDICRVRPRQRRRRAVHEREHDVENPAARETPLRQHQRPQFGDSPQISARSGRAQNRCIRMRFKKLRAFSRQCCATSTRAMSDSRNMNRARIDPPASASENTPGAAVERPRKHRVRLCENASDGSARCAGPLLLLRGAQPAEGARQEAAARRATCALAAGARTASRPSGPA